MSKHKKIRKVKEFFAWLLEIGILFLLAYLVSRFVVTHTFVPTGSMIPTIQINDHLMINRIPLYYRDPKAGEIVVFHENGKELIKRVIGVPGDLYDIRDGNVYINDLQLDEPYLAEQNSTYDFMMAEGALPFKIPEDRYFVMGDNRNNSEDSRYYGLVHRKAIYAKSWFRIWPLNRIGLVR